MKNLPIAISDMLGGRADIDLIAGLCFLLPIFPNLSAWTDKIT